MNNDLSSIFFSEYCRKHKLSGNLKPYGKCPITMHRNWRRCIATTCLGEATTLQAPKSKVSLYTPEGISAVLIGCVYTDYLRFMKAIPREECIIAPLVEFHNLPLSTSKDQPNPRNEPQYIIRIPHCIPNESDWEYIQVRSGDIHGDNIFTDIEKYKENGDQETYYKMDEEFIIIYTTHFTNFTCTTCKNFCCSNLAKVFLFGSIDTTERYGNIDERYDETLVKIQSFLCSCLYNIQDFRDVRSCLNKPSWFH